MCEWFCLTHGNKLNDVICTKGSGQSELSPDGDGIIIETQSAENDTFSCLHSDASCCLNKEIPSENSASLPLVRDDFHGQTKSAHLRCDLLSRINSVLETFESLKEIIFSPDIFESECQEQTDIINEMDDALDRLDWSKINYFYLGK